MNLHRCRNRGDYFELFNSPAFGVRWQLERLLALTHQAERCFSIPGVCEVCTAAVDFSGDFANAWPSPEGIAVPNWRECLRCPRCRLNGRERIMTRMLEEIIEPRHGDPSFVVYLMEAVSPVFRRLATSFPRAQLIGSEWLGADQVPGSMVGGIRHENAEGLSFADASIDVFVSCDVFEHVNDPAQAFRELVRVLKPGGLALMTFPMDPSLDTNRRRAAVEGGTLRTFEPAVYHGNPLSHEGSLVFTDFGWEVLAEMRTAGLVDPTLDVYWSYEHGYLGVQFYFAARTHGMAHSSSTN
jgi:SAM-dependent methyltransferase